MKDLEFLLLILKSSKISPLTILVDPRYSSNKGILSLSFQLKLILILHSIDLSNELLGNKRFKLGLADQSVILEIKPYLLS